MDTADSEGDSTELVVVMVSDKVDEIEPVPVVIMVSGEFDEIEPLPVVKLEGVMPVEPTVAVATEVALAEIGGRLAEVAAACDMENRKADASERAEDAAGGRVVPA